MRLRKPTVARVALMVVLLFVAEAMSSATGELVRIVAPADGQQVSGRIKVQARTEVEDPAYLIFCVDGARPHATNTEPYCYDLDTRRLADGPHALAVEVHAREGLIARSSPITIVVANAMTAPVLTVTAQEPAAVPARPASGAQPAHPGAADEPFASPVRFGEQPTLAAMIIAAPQPAAASPVQPVSQAAPTMAAGLQSPRTPTPVVVALDGRSLRFDVAPAVCEGRVFGPLRAVIEESGGAVSWLAAARQAVARRNGSELRVTIGASQAQLDGRVLDLGAVARLQSGRTVVPMRATCEPLGFSVVWLAESRTVQLCSAPAPVQIGMRQAQ